MIGLPEKLFFGTGIPAAILIFRKQQDATTRCCSSTPAATIEEGKNQNFLRDGGPAQELVGYLPCASKRAERYAYLRDAGRRSPENEFNLNIPRYVDTFEEEQEIDLKAVRREREGAEEGAGCDRGADGGLLEGVGI